MKFYSKSKTLKILAKKIKSAVVLPQFTLSIKDWYKNNKNLAKQRKLDLWRTYRQK